jgi:hypothetical protein
VIEDAYSDDKIMTRAGLHIYWDILSFSCYNTAESPDPFKFENALCFRW